MNHTRRNLLIVTLFVIAAIAGGLWVAVSGWPPVIIRDHQYRKLIGDFQRATHIDRVRPGDGDAGWEANIEIPESQTTAAVRAVAHMGVIRVKYSDEDGERPLYGYEDYSHPKEIRVGENILYAHWSESLMWTDHWVMAYDLAKRCEITRRRIDPGDLMGPH